jgi:hypothetical protein
MRVNALLTDFCDAIKNTDKLLKKTPSLVYAFHIYYNPHGLNFLINDILKDSLLQV